MLQGDNLSIQLFIAAAAINALSVAVTQAGWTHRWFVRGMFAVAVLLAVAAVGWQYIDTRIPLLKDALHAIASSRIAWFLSGIVPALIAGMFLNESSHRRRNVKVKTPPGWVSVNTAKRTFARNDLLEKDAHVGEQISRCANEANTLNARIDVLGKTIIYADEATRSEMSEELVRLMSEKTRTDSEAERWARAHDDCSEELRQNIVEQLQQGKLIARAFVERDAPGSSERIVPAGEWRFLIIDDEDDKALAPNRVDYIAVQIGRPT